MTSWQVGGILLGAVVLALAGPARGADIEQPPVRYSTAPAEAVGAAVVKAIRKDKAEIVVMPGPGRLIKALMDLFPSFGRSMNQMAGADATMRRVIEFRKRSMLSA